MYNPAPGEDPEKVPHPAEAQGQFSLGREVLTDARGNLLTESEVQERQLKKQQQQEDANSAGATKPFPQAAGGCCSHKQAVAQQMQAAIPEFGNAMKKECNCGDGCDCLLCAQHMHNDRTKEFLNQHAERLLHHNGFNAPYTQGQMMYQPYVDANQSCMGGQFLLSMSQQPQPQFQPYANPAPNGYLMSYPIHTPTDVQPYQMGEPQMLTMPYLGASAAPDISPTGIYSMPTIHMAQEQMHMPATDFSPQFQMSPTEFAHGQEMALMDASMDLCALDDFPFASPSHF